MSTSTTTQRMKEAGWFYHAPAKTVKKDQVAAPPASQIPGLSDLSAAPLEEPKRTLILESDSPYVRMAKMGGRPDLLRFRSPKPPSDEPKPYPRNDWFYQDDIALEESSQDKASEDYVFMLPDYMVHRDPKTRQNNQEQYTPNRLPYAYDKTTVYEREGEKVKDHTIAIDESRPHGYGVRSDKKKGKPVKAKPMAPQERGKAPAPQYDDGIPRPKPMPPMKEDSRPAMGKILSFGYAKDWQEERDKWMANQRENVNDVKKKPDSRGNIEKSEYQSSMAAKTPPVRSAKSAKSQRSSAKSSKKAGV